MKYEEILAWWEKEKTDTKEDIYTVLDNFRILFAYHSGRIENETITLHDTREIFENGSVINYTGICAHYLKSRTKRTALNS